MVRLYKTENVPDHLIQEVEEVIKKMTFQFKNILEDHHPNIILSAFNRLHAGLIVHLVDESGLVDAVRTEAIGLIKNSEHISGKVIMGED